MLASRFPCTATARKPDSLNRIAADSMPCDLAESHLDHPNVPYRTPPQMRTIAAVEPLTNKCQNIHTTHDPYITGFATAAHLNSTRRQGTQQCRTDRSTKVNVLQLVSNSTAGIPAI